MSDDHSRKVELGDTQYTIRRFKGLKAAYAGALISRVMKEIPELQERAQAYRKAFRESNTIRITPAMAKLPRFEPLGLTTEDFAAAGGNIEFPEEPTGQAIVMNVFPSLFDLALDELKIFFGILLIPNKDLEDADDADEVDESLKKWGKKALREGDIDELLELVIVGMEVFTEQMASKRDRLGELKIPWLDRFLNTNQEQPENLGPGQTLPTPEDEIPSQSTSSAQPSSSDAEDGDSVEATPSTEPLGVSSS